MPSPLRPARARRLLPFAALTALATLAACAMPTGDERVGHTSEAVTKCAAGSVVKGVDVSVYQGTIDWPTTKANGIDFAIARISDGSALDTQFSNNWAGMKSAGVVRGAYQFFEPGEDPMTQAGIVISAVGMLGAGDLPVTADMEVTGGQSAATIVANLQTWSAAVKAGTGKTPMIYTAPGYWNGSVGSTAFGGDPLWVANWGVTCPSLPDGWSDWVFWQDSDMGSVTGIPATVDLDEFNGTLAQLQSFAGGGTTSSDGGGPGYWAAQYVTQSWPLAATTMTMTTCQTVAASITLKNVGTSTWDSNTRLATTQPRDRASEFGDSTWISKNRAAQVTGTVPPGGTFEFKFDFHAPPTTGSYKEYFGLVEDGVAWFSDPGQGGPPDDDIEANIQVNAGSTNCTVDPGVPDGGSTGGGADGGDAGASHEAGSPGNDGGVGLGHDSGSTAPDAGGGWSSSDKAPSSSGGCGCRAAGEGQRTPGPWALLLLLPVAIARRARSRDGLAPYTFPAGL
jgi:lysozyme